MHSNSDADTYWAISDLLLAGPWPSLELLDRLELMGVTVLVNLTEHSYTDARFKVRDIPVMEFGPPEIEQIDEFCQLLRWADEEAAAVYVHCQAGCGRTGTMTACALVYFHKLPAGVAIDRIRSLRPCSIESDLQEEVVTAWAQHVVENNLQGGASGPSLTGVNHSFHSTTIRIPGN